MKNKEMAEVAEVQGRGERAQEILEGSRSTQECCRVRIRGSAEPAVPSRAVLPNPALSTSCTARGCDGGLKIH